MRKITDKEKMDTIKKVLKGDSPILKLVPNMSEETMNEFIDFLIKAKVEVLVAVPNTDTNLIENTKTVKGFITRRDKGEVTMDIKGYHHTIYNIGSIKITVNREL